MRSAWSNLLRARPMSNDKANTLLLLACCALVLLPHAPHLPLWTVPVCAALMAWRAWATFRGNRMPPRWLLWPLAILAIGGVLLTYRTVFGREAGVAMLSLLLTLKLLENRGKRDLFVVLFLCLFLLLASYFHSQSILTAGMTIVALIAILTTQMSFQYTGAMPSLAQRLRSSASIVALAVPLTLVLFVLFPRIQGPLWGLPQDAARARTGLSETMEPGNIANLARSQAIAFRAKFEGAPPAKPALYWRGIVLGDYDGRIWRPSPPRARAPQIELRGAPLRYQITLEPHGQRWLFALDVPREVPRLEGMGSSVSSELQLFAAQPINSRVRYDAVSHVNYLLQPRETRLEDWLRLPQGFNPRTLQLAAGLRSKVSSEAEAIDTVLQMFRDQPFRYTLQPPLLGTHVVDEFLFDTRAGFCEHYSGAFVVLMRAMGIPARVVTGYQGGEINPTDGFMAVRQSDAHAWSEVWLQGRGWVRVDPTAAVAPERVEQNLASLIPQTVLGGLVTLDVSRGLLAAQWLRLRHGWEAVNNSWNQMVLTYTADRQRDLLRRLGFSNPDWQTLGMLLVVCASVAAGFTLLLMALRQKRHDPLEALYRKLCLRMAARGYPRLPHEGPRAYAARLAASDSALDARAKSALARFLSTYEALRYGPPQPQRPSLAILKSLLAECR